MFDFISRPITIKVLAVHQSRAVVSESCREHNKIIAATRFSESLADFQAIADYTNRDPAGNYRLS
jgi:hypothetical protein